MSDADLKDLKYVWCFYPEGCYCCGCDPSWFPLTFWLLVSVQDENITVEFDWYE